MFLHVKFIRGKKETQNSAQSPIIRALQKVVNKTIFKMCVQVTDGVFSSLSSEILP